MAVSPQAQQSRDLSVELYTEGGWISGTLVVPKIQSLLAFVNRPEPFLKLSRVKIGSSGETLGFLSLQKGRVLLLVPIDAEERELQEFQVGTESHAIVALIGGGVVRGQVETPAKMRLSDYLMKNQGFMPLRGCSASLRTSGDTRTELPRALLNGAAVIGISEA
jgi:hypothetical protein